MQKDEKGEKLKKEKEQRRREQNRTEVKDENDEEKMREEREDRTELNCEKAAVQHLSCQLVLKFRQKQQRTRDTEQSIPGRIVSFPSPTMIKKKNIFPFYFYLVHTLKKRIHTVQYVGLIVLHSDQKSLYETAKNRWKS